MGAQLHKVLVKESSENVIQELAEDESFFSFSFFFSCIYLF